MAVVCRVLVGVMVDTWAPFRYVARMFWELAISSTGGRSTGSEDGTEKGQLGLLTVDVAIAWGAALQLPGSEAMGQPYPPFLALHERLSGCSR